MQIWALFSRLLGEVTIAGGVAGRAAAVGAPADANVAETADPADRAGAAHHADEHLAGQPLEDLALRWGQHSQCAREHCPSRAGDTLRGEPALLGHGHR